MSQKRDEVIRTVLDTKIIAIIRGFPPETCVRLAEAYLKGGIRMVEVTFPQADPDSWKKTAEAIRTISTQFAGEMLAGAGTVLTREQLQMAADAGGRYMIAPSVNTDLIREAVKMDLAAIPGAFTPTEVVSAYEAGASFVKLFPVTALGPSYMKVGCVGAGVSGVLTNKDLIASGAWDKITEVARALVANASV